MKAKKLLAALGVLIMAVPSVAFADSFSQEATIVEGTTRFVNLEDPTTVEFAAVAGKASQRTIFGGVDWFNGQGLFDDRVDSEKAAGNYVIATLAGLEDPAEHFGADCAEFCAEYVVSYQMTDPNGGIWMVDQYQYKECGTFAGGSFHVIPCPEGDATEDRELDVDEDGSNEAATDIVTHRSMFVVQIGDLRDNTAAPCPGATPSEVGSTYNFVALIDLGALGAENLQDLGGASSAQVDLWFEENRPAEPDLRVTKTLPAGTCAA